MPEYELCLENMRKEPRTWVVTGAAGFIGSNLVEELLRNDQKVVGLDNFSTGHQKNLDEVCKLVTEEQWSRFRFVNGDIRDLVTCAAACNGADYVLHQAALGSVPRSLNDPLASHDNNVTGTVNVFLAARDAGVRRVVYASSSSVYGDHPALPKVESEVGECLSPYAVTKKVAELYASVFARSYEFSVVGLRYFNVFGPRQDPNGPYAAVMPKWIDSLLRSEQVVINGDGETSRDFCYVRNAVQANLLGAQADLPAGQHCVFNVAVHARTTLNSLFQMIKERLVTRSLVSDSVEPKYGDFRPGDVRHSEANVDQAATVLGYQPTYDVSEGLDEAIDWYVKQCELALAQS